MQFLPATFAAHARPVPPGGTDPASPYDPVDAIHAAARYLCATGARNSTDLPAALYAYNHSHTYVTDVLAQAAAYTGSDTGTGTAGPGGDAAGAPTTAARTAVDYARAQLGPPRRPCPPRDSPSRTPPPPAMARRPAARRRRALPRRRRTGWDRTPCRLLPP